MGKRPDGCFGVMHLWRVVLVSRSNSVSNYTMLVCSSLKGSRFIKEQSSNDLHFVSVSDPIMLSNWSQFSLGFYVPTFRCLQAPAIFFDDLSSHGAYLSTFHLQMLSDKCYFHQYTCQLESTKFKRENNGSSSVTSYLNQTVKISVDHPTWFTQRLSNEQMIRPTNFIDHMSEVVILETSFVSLDTEFHRHAVCTHTNARTSREFLLCAEKTSTNYSMKFIYRTDVILCEYDETTVDLCRFALYQ